MSEVTVQVTFNIPRLELTPIDEFRLKELLKEIIQKEGSIGIIYALEEYLGK